MYELLSFSIDIKNFLAFFIELYIEIYQYLYMITVFINSKIRIFCHSNQVLALITIFNSFLKNKQNPT